MGAEQNHLCPVSSYSPSTPVDCARVVLARTSEPPCFSVMAIPLSALVFSGSGTSAGSYSSEVSFGSSRAASAGVVRSAGTAAKVMVTGHWWPGST